MAGTIHSYLNRHVHLVFLQRVHKKINLLVRRKLQTGAVTVLPTDSEDHARLAAPTRAWLDLDLVKLQDLVDDLVGSEDVKEVVEAGLCVPFNLGYRRLTRRREYRGQQCAAAKCAQRRDP